LSREHSSAGDETRYSRQIDGRFSLAVVLRPAIERVLPPRRRGRPPDRREAIEHGRAPRRGHACDEVGQHPRLGRRHGDELPAARAAPLRAGDPAAAGEVTPLGHADELLVERQHVPRELGEPHVARRDGEVAAQPAVRALDVQGQELRGRLALGHLLALRALHAMLERRTAGPLDKVRVRPRGG
jgi:hypothetical protein